MSIGQMVLVHTSGSGDIRAHGTITNGVTGSSVWWEAGAYLREELPLTHGMPRGTRAECFLTANV